MKTRHYAQVLPILGGLLILGCSAPTGRAPKRAEFLSAYHHMEQEATNTYRYVNYDRLKEYTKFIVHPVKIKFSEFKSETLTPEQVRKASEFTRATLIEALAGHYPVVDVPSADTAEIRVAVTDAYKEGNRVGLTVEGEILDSYTAVQVAAVMRTELGEPHLASWWEKDEAKKIVRGWAERLRQAIDTAKRR
jgi:hypothetical protein